MEFGRVEVEHKSAVIAPVMTSHLPSDHGRYCPQRLWRLTCGIDTVKVRFCLDKIVDKTSQLWRKFGKIPQSIGTFNGRSGERIGRDNGSRYSVLGGGMCVDSGIDGRLGDVTWEFCLSCPIRLALCLVAIFRVGVRAILIVYPGVLLHHPAVKFAISTIFRDFQIENLASFGVAAFVAQQLKCDSEKAPAGDLWQYFVLRKLSYVEVCRGVSGGAESRCLRECWVGCQSFEVLGGQDRYKASAL